MLERSQRIGGDSTLLRETFGVHRRWFVARALRPRLQSDEWIRVFECETSEPPSFADEGLSTQIGAASHGMQHRFGRARRLSSTRIDGCRPFSAFAKQGGEDDSRRVKRGACGHRIRNGHELFIG